MVAFPLSDFSHPVSSFPFKLTPPNDEPGDGVQVTFCYNRDYKPFLLGAMAQLTLQSTWNVDPSEIGAVIDKMERFKDIVNDDAFCNVGDSDSFTFDFAVSQWGWIVDPAGHGVYLPDVGFRTEWWNDGSLWNGTLQLLFTLPTPVYITGYEIVGSWVNDTTSLVDNVEVGGSCYGSIPTYGFFGRHQIRAEGIGVDYVHSAFFDTPRVVDTHVTLGQTHWESTVDESEVRWFEVNSITLHWVNTVV